MTMRVPNMRDIRIVLTDTIISVLVLFVCILSIVFLPVFWLYCRMTAQSCPHCGSQWQTEVIGEWDGETEWKCHSCGLMFCKKY